MIPIFVPCTRVSEATAIALVTYEYTAVDVSDGDFAYSRFLDDRWTAGETFVNVEHDCVPWPGAIEDLANCQRPWCVFDYHYQNPPIDPRHTPPLGCCKVSARLIKEIPDAWKRPVKWGVCDRNLASRARAKGVQPHQHFPGIVNANPRVLGGKNPH